VAGPRNQLTIQRILAWADAHHRRTGKWPHQHTGPIDASSKETWLAVDSALRQGCRGLRGGSSLARLLAQKRGVRNIAALPPLTIPRILAWADAHHQRTGKWPNQHTGSIDASPGDTWLAVDWALREGRRGLRGDSSLARLLAQKRGVRNRLALPPLTITQVLAWADRYHAKKGRWPAANSGPVEGVPDESWSSIEAALRQGHRGLPGGSSIARLLAEKRGVRNRAASPRLTIPQVLAWADACHAKTGRWPTLDSGPVEGVPDEKWSNINSALQQGHRGLPGGSSIARLLAERRGVVRALTVGQILAWADAHHKRTGKWPKMNSGPVVGATKGTWYGIDAALRRGTRGLPGGSSLCALLIEHRGYRPLHSRYPSTKDVATPSGRVARAAAKSLE